jgi:hypothetical protein
MDFLRSLKARAKLNLNRTNCMLFSRSRAMTVTGGWHTERLSTSARLGLPLPF